MSLVARSRKEARAMPKFYKNPECLADIVHQIIDELQLEENYLVEVDVPEDIGIPTAIRPLRELVSALTQQATREIRAGGDLTFIGWESEDVCELEIADSGCSIAERSCTTPSATGLSGAELQWQDCPQGGAAVTLRFSRRIAQRKVA